MDYSLPGSTVHGISQAKILEWVAISFSRGSSPSKVEPEYPALAGRFFTAESPGKPHVFFAQSTVAGSYKIHTFLEPGLLHYSQDTEIPSLPRFFLLSFYSHTNTLSTLSLIPGKCQEAFNKRLPVCCFGSVRNPLALINS